MGVNGRDTEGVFLRYDYGFKRARDKRGRVSILASVWA